MEERDSVSPTPEIRSSMFKREFVAKSIQKSIFLCTSNEQAENEIKKAIISQQKRSGLTNIETN